MQCLLIKYKMSTHVRRQYGLNLINDIITYIIHRVIHKTAPFYTGLLSVTLPLGVEEDGKIT